MDSDSNGNGDHSAQRGLADPSRETWGARIQQQVAVRLGQDEEEHVKVCPVMSQGGNLQPCLQADCMLWKQADLGFKARCGLEQRR